MRNLKKILALVLALMMTLSLMATASAKDFTDADEIQYTEAVTVMTGLGVLNGYPDGRFGAKDPLVRAAAAKIVAYIMEGGFDAVEDAATVLDNPFTDLGTASWLIASAKYLANEGMLLGYGDGRFGPNDPLVASAFGKLVLLAAGIGTAEDYVGDATQTFDTKVMVALKSNDLLKGIKETITAKTVLTREQACQIAWNAMRKGPEISVTKYAVEPMSSTCLAAYNAAPATNAAKVPQNTKADALTAAYALGAFTLNNDFTIETVVVKETDMSKTLAANFEMQVEENVVITSNQATVAGQKYTATSGNNYALETGKDLIGHTVDVYYKEAWTDADHPGVAYAVVDKSNVVTVASKLEGQTAAQVKTLLGLKNAPTATINPNVVYNYEVVGPTSNPWGVSIVPIVKGTDDKFTVLPGQYIVTDGALSYLKYEIVEVDTFTVSIQDAAKGYYTVTGTDLGVVEQVTGNPTTCVALVTNEIDWVGLNTAGTPAVVKTVTRVGDFVTLGEPYAFNGKVTKVDNANLQIYINGYPFYYNATAYSAEIVAQNAVNGVANGNADNISTLAATPDFANEYTFYMDGWGGVYAYGSASGTVSSAPALVVPVMLYQKSSTAAGDAYGNAGSTTYTYWIQGVTMDGLEVNLQVTWDEAKSFMSKGTQAGYPDSADGQQAWAASAANQWAPASAKFDVLYTYTVSEDTDLKAEVADFTLASTAGTVAVENSAGTVASTAKKADGSSKAFYLNDTYTVVYYTGTGKNLKTVVEAGKSSVIASGDILYGVYASGVTTGSNYELKYVVKKGSPAVDVPSTDIVYVAANFNSISMVPYTTSSGTVATGYAQTVYINGVKTDIITKAADGKDAGNSNTAVTTGFYTYTKDSVTGLYTLKSTSSNVKTGVTTYSLYQGMMTCAAASLTDVDVTNVPVVNVTVKTTVPTDATKLDATKDTLALVLDGNGGVAMIYVTASTRT